MKFLNIFQTLALFFVIRISEFGINGEVIQQDVDSKKPLTLTIDTIESFIKSHFYLNQSKFTLEQNLFAELQDFRIGLKYLQDFSSKVLTCKKLDSVCRPEFETQNDHDLFDPSSYYRKILSSLVKTYIASNNTPEVRKAGQKKPFFSFARNFLEKKTLNYFRCDTTASLQMKLGNLHDFIMSIMLKNYAIVSYTYQKKYIQLTSTNKTEAKNLYSEMQKVLESIRNDCYLMKGEAIVEMFKATVDIRRCNPHIKHEKNKTYERLTYFIQGWVGSEKFLNSTRECGGDCSFKETIFYKPLNLAHNNRNNLDLYKKLYAFEGTFYNCSIAPQFDTVYQEIQPAEPERLYHHLSLKKENEIKNFGQNSYPQNKSLAKFTIGDLKFNQDGKSSDSCKICLCHLDRDFAPDAVRAVNTNQVSVPPGRVVTGIRWAVKNQLVQLELRSHEFKDNFIVPSTEKWYDALMSADDEYSDNNYVYLTADKRSLCLEDVIVSEHKIIVGAKFVEINGLICLSIQGAEIINNQYKNYRWYSPHPEELRKRKELKLHNPDASHRETKIFDKENVVSMTGKHFIKFQPTDLLKDAAQTTVPYSDIQEICTDPPTPLQGLGIYYEGREGYGGFVALKIMTANVLIEHRLGNEFKLIDQLIN